MKSKFILFGLIASLIVVGAIVFIAKSTSHMNMGNASTAPTVAQEPNSIVIKNYSFSPSPLKVKKGTTVKWTNSDIAKHTITADSGGSNGPNGPLFGQGQTYSFTFNTAGTFAYHCEPHPYMHGSVEVSE